MATTINDADPALERWMALAERVRRAANGSMTAGGSMNDPVAADSRRLPSRMRLRVRIKKVWVKHKAT